jgi:hypothetical protein
LNLLSVMARPFVPWDDATKLKPASSERKTF